MPPARAVRLLASAATVAALALPAAGCKTTGDDITGSIGRSRARPAPRRNGAASLETWGDRYRANPSDAKAAIAYAKALRATDQRAQAVAVLEQASIRNPHDMAVLGAYGRALADAGQYSRRSTCSAAPIRRTSRTGASSTRKARCSTRWAATPRRSAITRPRSRSCPTSRRCCPISACPTRSTKNLPQAEATLAAARPRSPTPARRCGRTSRWSSGCRAASRRPRRSPAPICRPTRPPPMSLICAQMLAQRNDWKKDRAAHRCRLPDAGT